ncbi:MAG TPA: hypothetical protein PK530_11575 [Anaerolineales bacterium]|nr:hypothetical protein [Anaerolineales bacterium]
MPENHARYHSYLLRIWQDETTPFCRIQLEDPHTGERHGFATLTEVVEFLDKQLASMLEKPQPDS